MTFEIKAVSNFKFVWENCQCIMARNFWSSRQKSRFLPRTLTLIIFGFWTFYSEFCGDNFRTETLLVSFHMHISTLEKTKVQEPGSPTQRVDLFYQETKFEVYQVLQTLLWFQSVFFEWNFKRVYRLEPILLGRSKGPGFHRSLHKRGVSEISFRLTSMLKLQKRLCLKIFEQKVKLLQTK